MKAVTFHGPFNLKVEDVPDPEIKQPKDVIIKVTAAGICGSDMHALRRTHKVLLKPHG